MGESKIVRRGGSLGTKAPTLTFVSKDDDSITFTITNNDTATADIFWEVDDTTPDENTLELAGETTSGNITASGLDDDTEYTISAFANAAGKAGSATTSLTVTTDEIVAVTLGVEWDQDTDSLTRLDDAVGLTAGSDFDEFNPYKLRRCMVNDDLSINYYIDPDDPDDIGEVVNTGSYTTGDPADYTGGDGQVMVEIPKFWWKTDEPTSDQYQWRISDIAQSGYTVHPAFVTDGVEKDFIYMSAFEGSAATSTGTLRSISGVEPLAFRTLPQFRTQAQARGTGWQIQTYFATNALQVLYLVEYADFDSKSTIGRGYVDTEPGPVASIITTGRTIFLGNESGREAGTDGLTAISYRGVENVWGNLFKFVDGININNGEAFVANENFESDKFSGDYTSIGTLFPDYVFISDINFPNFLATEGNASSTSHLHGFHNFELGQNVASFGGFSFTGDTSSFFTWNFTSGYSVSNNVLNARLQIL